MLLTESLATSRGRKVTMYRDHEGRYTPKPPTQPRPKGLLQRDRIYQFLVEARGRGYTSSEIDEALGLPHAAASKVVTHLVREGRVQSVDGLYKVEVA